MRFAGGGRLLLPDATALLRLLLHQGRSSHRARGLQHRRAADATAGAALSDPQRIRHADQAAAMSSLVAKQKDNLYASATSNIVQTRTQIASCCVACSRGRPRRIRSKRGAAAVPIYGELDGRTTTRMRPSSRRCTGRSPPTRRRASTRCASRSCRLLRDARASITRQHDLLLYSGVISDVNVLTLLATRLPFLRA